MMNPNTPESNSTKHQQNDRLFAALEIAKVRLAELRAKPAADAMVIRRLEKQLESIRKELFVANRGLVAALANGFRGLLNSEELQQVGEIALMKAIEKFDPTRGHTFATFATPSIKGGIRRAIHKQSRVIRIPEGKIGEIWKLKQAKTKLAAEDGNEPSVEALARELGMKESKVRALLELEQQTQRMEASSGDAGGASPFDRIADTTATDPAAGADLDARISLLEEAVRSLSARDRDIFVSGAGILGHAKLTFEAIGKRHGISRERARQVYGMAKDKVAAFIRSDEARCAGEIAKRRLGIGNGRSSTAVAKATRSSAVPAKPYRLKKRAVEKNPNHHIWNNNGTWYCNFVLITETGKQTRVRNPLYTDNVENARRRRDKLILLYSGPCDTAA